MLDGQTGLSARLKPGAGHGQIVIEFHSARRHILAVPHMILDLEDVMRLSGSGTRILASMSRHSLQGKSNCLPSHGVETYMLPSQSSAAVTGSTAV